jgi:hypothetical protein
VQDATGYAIRSVTAFEPPAYPGILPALGERATQAAIYELQRVHTSATEQYKTYRAVGTALVQQILAAVESTYLDALRDVDLGFANVSPSQMLAHLKKEYGILTIREIEDNRAKLSEPWDIASPIETLWKRVTEVQRIATSVDQPISDDAVIALTLPMLRRTGVFGSIISAWEQRLRTEQTLATFKAMFTLANTTRLSNLTTSDVQYADANAANARSPPANYSATNSNAFFTVNGCPMYYCWSHGLSPNEQHTSATCQHPKEGHIRTATVFNRQGGSCNFNVGKTRGTHRATTNPNGN